MLLSNGKIKASPSSLSLVIEYLKTRTKIRAELKSKTRPEMLRNIYVNILTRPGVF